MKHNISWYLEKRIGITAYDGDLTLDELKQVNLMLEEFLNTGQSPVHLIIDTRKMGNIPPNINVVRETLDVFRQNGWGWMMLLGSNRLILFFAEVVGKQFGLTMKSVASIEEAEAVLRRMDNTL